MNVLILCLSQPLAAKLEYTYIYVCIHVLSRSALVPPVFLKIMPLHESFLIEFFSSHCIAFHFLFCIVLFV